MSSSKKTPLFICLVSALCAYAFFHSDTFWGIVICGLAFVWAAIMMLPLMDAGWRMRLGLAVVLFFGALICMWPTLDNMTDGKARCPRYIKDRVTFAIAPGLDLRGGLRLVYTVEVDQAIRDKSDRYGQFLRPRPAGCRYT